jgi:hypothetical protein
MYWFLFKHINNFTFNRSLDANCKGISRNQPETNLTTPPVDVPRSPVVPVLN